MSSPRKGTDLERLTQPGGKPMPDDASIPVLTERLTLPSLDLDISLPQPPPPVVAGPMTPLPPSAAAPNFAPQPAAPARPAIKWDAIESQLRERLLNELQDRAASELDRHLRERMQPAIDRALGLLMAELKSSIEGLIKDTVNRAVAAEIARHRDAK